MKWRLGSPFAYRRLIRSLDRISGALEMQTVLLARLADHLAPEVPKGTSPEESVSFRDEHDIVLSLDYIEKTRVRTGHTPSDEEVIAYLAEEKTQALQTRLNERVDLLSQIGGRSVE